MYRSPPRRLPRVAGLVTTRRGTVIVIVDPWEVRAVIVARRRTHLRNVLLRERPVVVARIGKRPDWLRRLRTEDQLVELPELVLSLASYPELRRFVGTPIEPVVRIALTLAENALIYARYERIS
jgi:hypothetical protein